MHSAISYSEQFNTRRGISKVFLFGAIYFIIMGLELAEKKRPEEAVDDFLQRPRQAVFTPDYKFRRFFFIVPFPVDSSHMHTKRIFSEQLSVAGEILRAAPDTKIDIFVKSADDVSKAMQALGKLKRYADSGRIRVKVGKFTEELWARDIGMPAKVRSFGSVRDEFVMGLNLEKQRKSGKRDVRVRWEAHDEKETGIRVTRIPIVVQGGNVTKTEIGKKKVLIVGQNDVEMTQEIYRHRGLEVSWEQIEKVYKKTFGVDEVIILGPDVKQTKPVFHIDQAVFFPKKGVAIILKPTDPENASKRGKEILGMLRKYKKQLQELGFSVIEIPTSMRHIERYESYANAVSIAGKGKTTVILPSFGDEKTEEEISRKLKENNMNVIFVPNTTGKHEGNIHCFTGALALRRINPIRTEHAYA